MSVWKNRDTYRYRIVRGGNVIAGSARTREEALILEAQARQQLAAGVTGIPVKRTIAEAIVRYLDSPEYLSLKSRRSLADKIGQWEPYLRGRTLDQARDVADEATADWRKAGLAAATINRRLAALRRVLSLCFRRWDWLDRDIAGKIALLPGETQRQVWLTRKQSIQLRRACPPGKARAAISLLLATGLRVGELLGLREDQVIDGAIYLDARTKTGRPRAVPILPPGERYTRHVPIGLTYDGLRSAFDKAKRRADLHHIRLHDLRHTLGSQLAEGGASLRDIQVWLGHTSPTTTTRYTHVELARLRAVARKLLPEKQ